MVFYVSFFYISNYLVLIVSIISISLVHSQINSPKLPRVGIYYAKLYGEPQLNQEKSVVIEDEDAWLGLKCSYEKAVRWVYKDEADNPVQPTFSALHRITLDFYDPSTYTYEAYMEILFKYTLANYTYLACVAYEDESLITIVSGINKLGEGTNFTVEDDRTIESRKNILSDLVPPLPDDKESEDVECPIKFLYYDKTSEEGAMNYFWNISDPEFINNVATAPTIFILENLRRSIKAIERRCVTPNATIPNKLNRFLEGRRSNFMGTYYTAETDTVKRIAKGFHSVSNGTDESRQFYFSWEDFPENKMCVVQGIPDEVYDKESINIIARFSPFYFSSGVLVMVHRSNDPVIYKETNLAYVDENQVDKGTILVQIPLPMHRGSSSIQNITVNFPRYNSFDWVTVQHTITVKESQKASFVNDSIVDLIFNEGDKDIEVVCTATGIPPPLIKFISPRADINFTENYVSFENQSTLTITFESITTTTKGNYSCVASNFLNKESKTIEIDVIPKGPDTTFSRNVFIGFGIASFMFLIVAIFLFLRIRAKRREYERKTAEAISEFLCGTSQNNSHSTEANANHEYNSDYELPFNHWHLKNEIMGQGSFAVVVKGYISLRDGERLVAVKKIMSPSNIEDFKCALYELKIMTCLGFHQNIVTLIASCIDNINERQMLLGLEYCCHGDLLSYLQKRRSMFVNYTKDGQVAVAGVEDEKKMHVKYDNVSDSSTFSTLDLYKWSFQTANGMGHLESKRIVHGDLSARNLLLNDDKTIKIGDFGLARQISKTEENKPFDIAHEAMPWKWMAIECLKNRKLSFQSDIWAYGVTLWEIFSLGEIPYPGFTYGPEFLEELEKGMRMGKPKFVTDGVYDLMVKSWNMEPHDRPSFEDVKLFFMKEVGKMEAGKGAEQEKYAVTDDKAEAESHAGNEAAYCILID